MRRTPPFRPELVSCVFCGALLALSCGAKDTDSAGGLTGVRRSGPGHICANYWLEDIELEPAVDFWALRTPDAPSGQRRADDWSTGEACETARDQDACHRALDETWQMNRGWGYQGALELSFMVTTRADIVERHDSNGALLELFGALGQPEEVLFYAGALGYVPRCDTLDRADDGTWQFEARVVTSDCPYVRQLQVVAVALDGTLHTLDVLRVEQSANCTR